MKLKVSLFDRGLSRDALRKLWPLIIAYAAAGFGALPLVLIEESGDISRFGLKDPWLLDACIYESIQTMSFISFVTAILAAMLLFGFLYNSRSCGMIASLPIRREKLFSTLYLTGLLSLFAVNIITAFVTTVLFAHNSFFHFTELLRWLAAVCMGNVCFFGFAVFCAMLTGSIVILPGVYIVLSFTAALAELALRAILGEIVYGYVTDKMFLSYLSPAFALADESGSGWAADGTIFFQGTELYVIYCICGIAFTLFALRLFKNRRMETAGDTVSKPVLKPLFKYCLAFGTAKVLAAAVFKLVFVNMFEGAAAAAIISLLMLFGAFVGYFAAEMLIQKTPDVFRSGWHGMAVVAAVIIAFSLSAELDIFGYEKLVPQAEDIENVEFQWSGINYSVNPFVFDTEDGIQAVTDIHSAFIADKRSLEGIAKSQGSLMLSYTMKDGQTLERWYRYAGGSDLEALTKLESFSNSESFMEKRYPVLDETLGTIEADIIDTSGNGRTLTREESIELYNDCLRPDAFDGSISALNSDSEADNEVYIYFSAYEPTDYRNRVRIYINIILTPEAERTLEWVRNNTDLDV